MEMTIKQFMEFANKGGFDIGDDVWDWGVYFDLPRTIDDNYDKFCEFVANNLTMVCYRDDWYSTCKVTEFLTKFDKAFRKFTNECNNENYQLGDCEIESDQWFETIFPTFESLIVGGYSENDYGRLVELLNESE